MDYTTQISDLPHIQSSPFQDKPATSRRRATLSPAQIVAAMKFSVYESFPAQIFTTLTGGVFMPAFALALGANNFFIGALAAIPFFANLFQLAGAYFVENYQGRKKLCVITSSVARILWAPAIILALLLMPQDRVVIRGILLALLILVYALLAVSGVAWLSWMNDIVPDGIRGRYFGFRNSVVSIATSLATFAGGWLLDIQHGSLNAFGLLFVIASAAGAVCTVLLSKQPESPKIFAPRHENFFQHYLEPFCHPNFRRLLRFSMVWQFAFNVASPFFVVYTLKELGASYVLTAVYSVITAVFDLIGMRVWGHISDRTGNKPVITIVVAVISTVPLAWLFTLKNAFNFYCLLPVLYAAGGFFWAGYNLCSTNLMFRLASRERDSIYFGAWAACNGLAACAGSLLGGVLGKWAATHQLDLFFFSLASLKTVFLLTSGLRLAAAWFLRPIRETKGMRTRQALQLLRYMRNWWLILKEDANSHANKLSRDSFAEENFWPLFGRKKIVRRFSTL